MKKKILSLLLAALMLLTAAGCASVFEADYYHEEDFSGDLGNVPGTATEISNYNMLKTALTNLIIRHEERGEFRFSNYAGRPSEDLAAACFEIRTTNPLGAYAVETLTYETNRVVSFYVADVYISYKRTAQEIQSIQYANTQSDFRERLIKAVDSYQNGAVIRMFSPAVDEDYIIDTVRRHYYDDPVTTVLEPKVRVESFPNEGENRVYDIQISYALPFDRIIPMSLALDGKIYSAASAMQQTEPAKLALEAAAYLSMLCSEQSEKPNYPDTAYGVFLAQNADARGFALAYRALCDRLGIECTVVEGVVGTMGAQPHFWNIICLGDAFYHVDVSAFAANPAAAFLLSDSLLWGKYIWDTAEYPACSGSLTYAQVVELQEEAEPQPEDGTPAPTDTTEAPQPEEPASGEAEITPGGERSVAQPHSGDGEQPDAE
ncbi:MAG: hypothetical protein E7472_08085 [Ruminococcaceae bacterium]|nr:hypothetical protein [Oscillospiraceae bacterium]